ncbi:dbp2 [Symbiodinium natans]|uniref:RNA helicase n=1 Tax=Symbiodinium natans TaxID=878477 RepID=A0A812KEE8_9DINO|nr:dbp2 [Symbiodinium natans]
MNPQQIAAQQIAAQQIAAQLSSAQSAVAQAAASVGAWASMTPTSTWAPNVPNQIQQNSLPPWASTAATAPQAAAAPEQPQPVTRVSRWGQRPEKTDSWSDGEQKWKDREQKSNWWSEKSQPYRNPQDGAKTEWQDRAQASPPEPLIAPDWSKVPRQPFQRKFLCTLQQEEEGAEKMRQQLGICIEDRGSLLAAPKPISSFEELQVLPQYVIEGLSQWNINAPMPVQSQALPLAMSGCNLVGIAQTGSGKTLAYLLPAIVQIEAQEPVPKGSVLPIALILAPTRELAVQITEEATKVLRGSRSGSHKNGIWASSVYGGGKKYEQIKNLQWGCEVVAATPGRLIDFLTSKVMSLERVTLLVLDEADRMLVEGFAEEVNIISAQIRPERQVLFFSATWAAEVQALAAGLCHSSQPVRLSVDQEHGSCMKAARKARQGIVQEVVVVDFPDDYEKQVAEKRRRLDDHLHEVLWSSADNKVLVFVSQKTYADELATKLWDAGFQAAAMHGGKSQEARLATLDRFRKGELRLLVATDVIGRGIDIPSVSHVVVFDMGGVEDYIHRIGRTARGKDGTGHALVFFEYWHKDPGIAAELAEALASSGQPVPPELLKIVQEVAAGQRQVWKGNNSKWSGKRWASNEWSRSEYSKHCAD